MIKGERVIAKHEGSGDSSQRDDHAWATRHAEDVMGRARSNMEAIDYARSQIEYADVIVAELHSREDLKSPSE